MAPWSGGGTYSRSDGTFTGASVFQQQNAAGTAITDTRLDAEAQDMADAINLALCKDGQNVPTANLPMATFRHTGVSDGAARDQYSSVGQAQDGKLSWAVAGGAADALTATYSPALAALVDGQYCFVRAAAANATTTPTFAPNGLTAHTITKTGGAALVVGEWATDQELILRYKLASTRWELVNPTHQAHRSMMMWGSAVALTAGTTSFIGPWGASSTEGNVQVALAYGATLRNLQVFAPVAPGAGQSFTATLRNGGAATALTAAITDAATAASDTTHSVVLPAGSVIDVRLVASAGAASSFIGVAFELFVP